MRYRDHITGQTVSTERQLPAPRYEKLHEEEDCWCEGGIVPGAPGDEREFTIPAGTEVRPRDGSGRFLSRDDDSEEE